MSQRSQLLSQEELDMSQMGYGFAPESLNRGTIPSMQEPPESQHLKTGPALVYSVAEQPYLEHPDVEDDFDENKQAGRWVRGFLTCCAVCHIFAIMLFIIVLVAVSVGLNMFLYEVEYPGITHVIRKQMPAVEGGGSAIDLIDEAALLQRLSGSNSAKMKELIPVLQQRQQRPTAPAAAFVEFSVDHEGEVTQLEDHQPQAVAEWQSVSPAAGDYEHSEAAPGSFLEVVAGRGPPRGGLPLTLPGVTPNGNKPGGKNGSSLQSLDDIVEMFEDMVPDDGKNTNNPRGGRRGGGESWPRLFGRHVSALTYLLGFASQEEHHPLVLFGSDIHSGLNAVFNDRNARIGAYLELVRLGKVDKQTWEKVLTRNLSADKLLAEIRSKRQAATSAKTNSSPGPQGPPQQPQNSFLEFLEAGAPPVVPGAPQSPRRPKQVKDLKNRDLAQCPVLQKFTPSTIGRPYALNITTVVFLFLAAVGLCHLSCCKCCACGTSRARFGKGWVPAIMLWLVVASELVIFGVRLGYPSASQVFPDILGEHVFKAFQEELEMVRATLGLGQGTSVQAAGVEGNVFREGFLGMARMNRIALGEIKNAWDPEPVKLDVSDRARVRAARILYSIVGPDMDKMVTALGAFTDEDELLGALLGKDSTFLPAAAKAKAPAEGAISLETQRQMNDLLGNNVLKQLLGPFERILEAASKSIVNFKNGGNPPVGMQVGLWKFEAGFIVMTLLTLAFLFVGIGFYGQWNPNKA